ncbi:carbamoyltransferase C-terminal domain-containing protein [Catellatospora sp. NPDC049609]|uniref:carbamoyltransferase C-terminal domain-containing protein n=1 Tax=Catellatospora sp. NPDC049609 TaxID=3155505 RepID=UPI00343D841E
MSFKPGHDGTIALLTDGVLAYSLEAEKDSFDRYADVTPSLLLEAAASTDQLPDVVCVSGWVKGFHSADRRLGAGYFGWDGSHTQVQRSRFFGHDVQVFSSTHERSHLLSAYGMSPYPQGEPCYALVWEGNIGSFYEISPDLTVTRVAEVMEDPGNKYQYIFALADPSAPSANGGFRFSNAGKFMALAGYADGSGLDDAGRELIEWVLSRRSILLTSPKEELADSPFHDIGVESQALKNLAAHHSAAIFDRFFAVATRMLTKGYPLLIAGGCGLNCDWNTRWRECGLFDDVFVPPCPNDTGSAIGTAVDAQRHFTGSAKITWSVYAGQDFDEDAVVPGTFTELPLNADTLAELLADDRIIAVGQGRAEIGPRALGNRSLLAAPFRQETRDRLNKIKFREGYRPVAPVCREEDVSRYFDWTGPSPYMLYFQQVTDSRLGAVTHADGTARVQTVRRDDNPLLYDTLGAFARRTGVGVLCNTSLNFPGKGFVNRTSDLVELAVDRGLDGFVVGERLFVRAGR